MSHKRFRTDKSRTAQLIRLMFGRRFHMAEMEKLNNPETVDQIADSITVPGYKVLEFNLRDLARELWRVADELGETRQIEPMQLQYTLRRHAAAYAASLELFPLVGKGSDETAKEVLRHPHRMKGVEIR
ncbi:hypothetical protein DNA98_05560 [Meiothermus sp. Pnk-1]|nr:hypothetical protein DNA98_05560 [Meiothermus sp. Pnk-1]